MKKIGASMLLLVLCLFYLLGVTSLYAEVNWWSGFDWNIIDATSADPGDSLSFYDASGNYKLVLSDMDLSGEYYTGFDSYHVYDIKTGNLIKEANYKDGLSTSLYQTIVGNQSAITEIVATETMRTSVKQTTSLISTHIGQIFRFKRVSKKPKQPTKLNQPKITLTNEKNSSDNLLTGLAAGDDMQTFGVWANGSGTIAEDTTESSEFDSTLAMGILGLDYMVSSNIVTGLAVGGERTRMNTKFNDGRLDTNGFTLALYFAMLVNEYCSFNITGGYSWLNSDQNKLNGTITGSMDLNRWFGTAMIYGYYDIGQFNITGILGYTHSQENIDEYIESDNTLVDALKAELGTVTIGIELGYQVTDMVEIYSGVDYNYDTTYNEIADISYDRDAFTVGMGLRTSFINNISLDLNLSTMLGRDDQTETSGMINIRYDF